MAKPPIRCAGTANPETKNLDVQGFDSVRLIGVTGGIPESIGNFPRNLDSEIPSLWVLSMWTGRKGTGQQGMVLKRRLLLTGRT